MIFLDTSFLYPLFNVEEEDHARVRDVFETLRGRRLNELLLTTPQRIYRPAEDEERAAFDYFKRFADQEYSMVDCLSFVVMERLGITEASPSTRTSYTVSSRGRALGGRGRRRAGRSVMLRTAVVSLGPKPLVPVANLVSATAAQVRSVTQNAQIP